MKYTSTEIFESKEVPGIIFKLRKMSHGRRIKLNASVATTVQKIIEIRREQEPLLEDLQAAEDAAKMEPCTCNHEIGDPDPHFPETLQCKVEGCDCRKPAYDQEKYQRFFEIKFKVAEISKDELNPAYVRWGVESIEGLHIDGEPATVETFIECAPEPLMDELVAEITRLVKMTPQEQLAFKSPTTSEPQVEWQTKTSSVQTASETNSIVKETAGSTSPNS